MGQMILRAAALCALVASVTAATRAQSTRRDAPSRPCRRAR